MSRVFVVGKSCCLKWESTVSGTFCNFSLFCNTYTEHFNVFGFFLLVERNIPDDFSHVRDLLLLLLLLFPPQKNVVGELLHACPPARRSVNLSKLFMLRGRGAGTRPCRAGRGAGVGAGARRAGEGRRKHRHLRGGAGPPSGYLAERWARVLLATVAGNGLFGRHEGRWYREPGVRHTLLRLWPAVPRGPRRGRRRRCCPRRARRLPRGGALRVGSLRPQSSAVLQQFRGVLGCL